MNYRRQDAHQATTGIFLKMPITASRSSLRGLAAVVLIALASTNLHALGLRCGNRVVAAGMISAQVRNACGAPFWTDAYVTLEVFGAGAPVEEQREIDWDVWYYNFGPSNLMQRLSFRDGRLQKIESLGYGVDAIGTTCLPAAASRGLTSGELVARCGEPSSRQRSEAARIRRVPGALFANEERREEWLYDDGSGYLTRYRISDGQVTQGERFPR